MIKKAVSLLVFTFAITVQAQQVLWDYLDESKILKGASWPEQFEKLSQWFLGKPYEEGTLEKNEEEELVIYTKGFDCVTFIENVMALHAAIGSENLQVIFSKELQQNRYYEGEIDGYESRIHYFSGWLKQAEASGKLKDMGRIIGEKYEKNTDFMSTHNAKYPKIRNVSRIREIEMELNRKDRYYLPKKEVEKYVLIAQKGDIVAFTTTISGLDVVHTGFVTLSEFGEPQLFHASSAAGKIKTEPLEKYLFRYKYIDGIMIFRPLIRK